MIDTIRFDGTGQNAKPFPVTDEINAQFMQVRDTGLVNMMDRYGVQSVANDLDCYALVVWIEDVGRTYGRYLSDFRPTN